MRAAAMAAASAAFLLTGGAEAGSAKTHISCTGAPNEVRVVIENVKKSVGLVSVELYRNDPATFLSKEGRENRLRFAAVAPRTEVCIHAPAASSYALAVYHDQNANMKFDKGALGIPIEPYGVSNNPKMRLGPPAIEEALFAVEESGAKVEITLRN